MYKGPDVVIMLCSSSQALCSRLDGVIHQTELVEQLDGRLPSQAAGPQVGHLLLGTSTAMTLRHLLYYKQQVHVYILFIKR